MLEAHYAAPMIGAVLNPINIRLDRAADRVLPGARRGQGASSPTASSTPPSRRRSSAGCKSPIVIDIADAETAGAPELRRHRVRGLHRRGRPGLRLSRPRGRVGQHLPALHLGHHRQSQGRVYSHRGAYLGALANALTFKLDHESRYLWTLPMFHCSGWTYHLGGHGRRRHARVPAQGRAQAHLRCDRRASRHPHVRRADRAQHAGPRAGRGQAAAAACAPRWRPAARRRPRRSSSSAWRRWASRCCMLYGTTESYGPSHLLRADGGVAGLPETEARYAPDGPPGDAQPRSSRT